MNDKLLIITKLKKTIEYVDKHLDNFPHKHIELKIRIIDALYELLESAYFANIVEDRYDKQSYCIVKIQMIDYYLKRSYKKEIISKKTYESLSKHLLEINKMLYSWRDYEET